MASVVKINIPKARKPRILVAPLDWGLGHATRCVPIIKELLICKCEVWIAVSGDQKALLQGEFPNLSYVELPGYQVRYDKNRAFTMLRLVGSIPKILIRIKKEHHWLREFRKRVELDGVISDNRYGLWGKGLFSVLVIHQLEIRTSLGRWMDGMVRQWHYGLMRRFSAIWVPDIPDEMGLAGSLSHPGKMPEVPVRYVGVLSRMEGEEKLRAASCELREEAKGVSIDLLVLLSGPEPQRTMLEGQIWRELEAGDFLGRVVFVRGKPVSDGAPLGGLTNVEVYDHLPAAGLNKMMLRSKLVVARAGYSTIMDLVRLKKRSILIPTPGQTEQEYLGQTLSERGVAVCVQQKGFSLATAVGRADQFPYVFLKEGDDLLKKAVAQSFSPDLG